MVVSPTVGLFSRRGRHGTVLRMAISASREGSGPPLVLAVGQFDGVHIGHQVLLRSAVESARRRGGVAGCLTFWPHVAQQLDPAHAPLLLATPEQNQERMIACGIQQIHTLPFTHELAAMGPMEFLALLKLEFPALAELVVGENFTFGKQRAGTAAMLPEMARAVEVAVQVVPLQRYGGEPISSTRIRAAVQAGDLPLARALLGRRFALAGMVVRGRAVGRTLGFPTANVQPVLPIRPAPGVYAARLRRSNGAESPGAAFVPDPADPAQQSFGHVVEIHVPGFAGDLYGEAVEVSFTRRLRGFMPFADPAAAANQIRRDLVAALAADAAESP